VIGEVGSVRDALERVRAGQWRAWRLVETHPPVLQHRRSSHRVVASPPTCSSEELAFQVGAAIFAGAPDIADLVRALRDLSVTANVQWLILEALREGE